MTISTNITRLAKMFALALAAAAFAVPAASANDGLVDDWFRDTNVVATAPVTYRLVATSDTDRIVDDWFRDPVMVVGGATPRAGVDPATGRPLRESGGAPVAYQSTVSGFQAPPAGIDPATGRPLRESGGHSDADQSTAGGFQWDDFGIGAGAMLGLVLLLAGIGLGALTVRHRGGQLKTS
jgi:hypothetical protein